MEQLIETSALVEIKNKKFTLSQTLNLEKKTHMSMTLSKIRFPIHILTLKFSKTCDQSEE